MRVTLAMKPSKAATFPRKTVWGFSWPPSRTTTRHMSLSWSQAAAWATAATSELCITKPAGLQDQRSCAAASDVGILDGVVAASTLP
ncbi:unnamed protein product [Symbiodinium sp. KB8]|nr:unnamed protein product [Symbiodinium sp. KB8]